MPTVDHLSKDSSVISTKTQSITLTDEDVAAAKRLLALLSEDGSAERLVDSPKGDRRQLLDRARLSFRLRQRRREIFGTGIIGEPAFDILLALYVSGDDGAQLTLREVAGLAQVTHATSVRWVDYLASKKFVEREPQLRDRRKIVVKLTDRGRQALDTLFRHALAHG